MVVHALVYYPCLCVIARKQITLIEKQYALEYLRGLFVQRIESRRIGSQLFELVEIYVLTEFLVELVYAFSGGYQTAETECTQILSESADKRLQRRLRVGRVIRRPQMFEKIVFGVFGILVDKKVLKQLYFLF